MTVLAGSHAPIKPKTPNKSTFVVYDGPSRLDPNRRIVALLFIGRSKNAKTGEVAHLTFLTAELPPVAAAKLGHDAAICGDCPLRRYHGTTKTCYVNLGLGVAAMYKAWKRGAYDAIDPSEASKRLKGKTLRLGQYGDPASAPPELVLRLARSAKRTVGYTHQWRQPHAQHLKTCCMASCETQGDATLADATGWRSFRVAGSGDSSRSGNEIACPASREAGFKKTCETCGSCNGRKSGDDGRMSVVIQDHFGLSVSLHNRKLAKEGRISLV